MKKLLHKKLCARVTSALKMWRQIRSHLLAKGSGECLCVNKLSVRQPPT